LALIVKGLFYTYTIPAITALCHPWQRSNLEHPVRVLATGKLGHPWPAPEGLAPAKFSLLVTRKNEGCVIDGNRNY